MWKPILAAGLAASCSFLFTTQVGHAATSTAGITLTPQGTLTLNTAPNFAFGKSVLTGGKVTLKTDSDTPVQVSNPGFSENWAVTMKLSQFSTGTQTLKGATMTLNQGAITSWKDNTSMAPSGVGNDMAKFTPGGAAQTVFVADQSRLSAPENFVNGQRQYDTVGVGVWNSDTSAVLSVPEGIVPGTYHATMTWSLVASTH